MRNLSHALCQFGASFAGAGGDGFKFGADAERFGIPKELVAAQALAGQGDVVHGVTLKRWVDEAEKMATTLLPSGLKAAASTESSSPWITVVMGLRLLLSQSSTWLSLEMERMRRPSWLKATAFTAVRWPRSGKPMGFPVATSQRRRLRSEDPETICRP